MRIYDSACRELEQDRPLLFSSKTRAAPFLLLSEQSSKSIKSPSRLNTVGCHLMRRQGFLHDIHNACVDHPTVPSQHPTVAETEYYAHSYSLLHFILPSDSNSPMSHLSPQKRPLPRQSRPPSCLPPHQLSRSGGSGALTCIIGCIRLDLRLRSSWSLSCCLPSLRQKHWRRSINND